MLFLLACDSVIRFPVPSTALPGTELPPDSDPIVDSARDTGAPDTSADTSPPPDTATGATFEVVPYDGAWTVDEGEGLGVGVFPLHVQVADFDGDGKDDLAFPWTESAGEGGPVFVNVHRQEAGELGAAEVLEIGHSVAVLGAFLAEDLDGDGLADLVVGHDDGFTVFYARPIGFEAPEDVSGPRVDALAAGDLDGDGDLDLVTVGTTVVAWLRTGGGHTRADEASIGGDPAVVTLVDVDPDGHLDVLVGETAGSFRVLPGDGAGGLDDGVAYEGTLSDVVVVDLDADEVPDVVATGLAQGVPGPNIVGWRVQDGLGDVWPLAVGLPWFPLGIATGDLDGDGTADLFAMEEYADTGWIWLDRGGGSWGVLELDLGFWPMATVFPDPNAVGDLDGDGCGDLAWRTDDDVVVARGRCG